MEQDLWFTTVRVRVHQSRRDGGVSILQHDMAQGFSPPLHVHRDEAETFCVIRGELRFQCDGQVSIAGPGDVVHAPAGSKHSFLVLSSEGASFLSITNGGFEDMVREVSRPAAYAGLPEQAAPTPLQQKALFEAGMRQRIELIGAPLAA